MTPRPEQARRGECTQSTIDVTDRARQTLSGTVPRYWATDGNGTGRPGGQPTEPDWGRQGNVPSEQDGWEEASSVVGSSKGAGLEDGRIGLYPKNV